MSSAPRSASIEAASSTTWPATCSTRSCGRWAGRQRITSFLRNDATPELPAFADNTVAVLEYERAHSLMVDIAAMEPRPMARRYEVYGTLGSAIITEPFEPARQVRLVLEEATGEYAAGEHVIEVPLQSRQDLYDRELEAFLAVAQRRQEPDRSLDAREPCAGDVAALCRYPGVSSIDK